MTDLEIAQAASIRPIAAIADQAGIPEEALIPYGRSVAKVDPSMMKQNRHGRLVLVTAINPTPAGEGKTTVSIALADALRRIGVSSMLALREPSLGPVFGMKGGATGGGFAQVLPMEQINLHFTGDLHAISAANNLLAAMLDNHLQQGNALRIDPRTISWRRCLDVNDRQLRSIVSGLGGKSYGVPHEDGFDITAASDVMAVFCLAESLQDLKQRLGQLIVARNVDGQPVTAADLHAHGAMTVLLKDAFLPNLVQTIEGTPCLMHGGPFANIAHGCNSIAATRTALRCADMVVTEAGFGADLGAEKFMDIKCRKTGLFPDALVLVATIRALKHHGGSGLPLQQEDLAALQSGMKHLLTHAQRMQANWGLKPVIAINRFATDTDAELALLRQVCNENGLQVALCEGWSKGGAGAIDLARLVMAQPKPEHPSLTYPDTLPLADKIRAVAQRVYGAKDVSFSAAASRQLNELTKDGFGVCPVCIAKTQYSFSDDPKALNVPADFPLTIRHVKINSGAGFVIAFAGDIIAMPGLPKKPAAESIDVDQSGQIVGMF